MDVEVSFKFIVQPITAESAERYNQSDGTIEVIDPDGARIAFVKTNGEALKAIRDSVEDMGIYSYSID